MVTWSWPGAVKGSVFFFSCCSGSFCCLWDFLVAASGDYSLTSVLRLLGFSLPWLLLLGRVDLRAHRLSSCGTQAWLPRGMWDLGSQTRGQIHIPCIGRWTLNCWAPGELWDISLRVHAICLGTRVILELPVCIQLTLKVGGVVCVLVT